MDQEQCMLHLYNYCCSQLSNFEIWDGYYKRRFNEFKNFYSLFPKKTFSNTLEIGCGIGYQAGFLSCISENVTASDVDYGDMIQHSRGLDIAKKFIAKTGIKNIEVVNANAENLPFEDEQFDFIYSSYSFQYIENKGKALQEIRRVLKKDGYFFCVLPTSANRIKATINYYKIILQKIPRLFKNSFNKNSIAVKEAETIAQRKWYTKLLPPPDDNLNNFFNEFFLYSNLRWQKLFLKNQHQIHVKKYTSFSNSNNNLYDFFRNIKARLISDGVILVSKK